MTGGRATWTNWVGNQSFVAELATPRREDEVVEHVRAAIARRTSATTSASSAGAAMRASQDWLPAQFVQVMRAWRVPLG